jgi:ABC-type sugar transport system substrate-binding protein
MAAGNRRLVWASRSLEDLMGIGIRRAAAVVAAAGLIFAGCGSAATTAPTQQPSTAPAASVAAPSVAAASAAASQPAATAASGAPYTFALRDGSTFTLAQSIADKIKNKQPLNIYMSYQSIAEPGAPYLLTAGLNQAADEMSKKYGVTINTKLIGTPETDPAAQISQVQQLVSAGQLDCVGIEPVTPDAFSSVINSSMAAGVPVMTVNTDSPKSNRLAYYGVNDVDPTNELFTGRTAGQFTVDWAKKNNVNLTKVALITGDTTAPWAQGRMQGWIDVVKAAFPNVEVVGTPTNAFTTGYDPAQITPKMISFMNGHPDVQFYFSSDWEGAEIAQLIGKNGLKDKVFTLGFNMDQTMLTDLDNGTLIGTVDQRYDLQAKTFAEGCAELLLGGIVPTEWQYLKPTVWTPATAGEARKLYESLHAL